MRSDEMAALLCTFLSITFPEFLSDSVVWPLPQDAFQKMHERTWKKSSVLCVNTGKLQLVSRESLEMRTKTPPFFCQFQRALHSKPWHKVCSFFPEQFLCFHSLSEQCYLGDKHLSDAKRDKPVFLLQKSSYTAACILFM